MAFPTVEERKRSSQQTPALGHLQTDPYPPLFVDVIILDQTIKVAIDNMALVEARFMNEVSLYVVEQNAWSILSHCEVHFRLTYERVFVPAHNLWRDFLVHCEETGPALPA